MKYNINVTSQEEKHIIEAIKEDFFAKFPDGDFDTAYKAYKEIEIFDAMDNIFENTNDGDKFSKEAHMIMRLVATYHINQALQALKYNTLSDSNLMTDGGGNIGTPGRIAKLWAGNGLDADKLTELGSGRFSKKPRMAGFQIKRIELVLDGEKVIYKGETIDKFDVETLQEGQHIKFTYKGKVKSFLVDTIDGKENVKVEDIDKSKKAIVQTIDNEERKIVKKEITNQGVGSTCSHHFLPFFILGKEHDSVLIVAYKPFKENIGISKITKFARWCLARPSLQEGVTDLIYEEMCKAANTEDVFVGMYGVAHTCEITRGSCTCTSTTTERAGGIFHGNEELTNNLFLKG